MTNITHEGKVKNARRWFIIFLIMGIIGALNLISRYNLPNGDGALTVYVGTLFGGTAAVIVQSLSELTIVWIIIAILSRRQMNKLIREQKVTTPLTLNHTNEGHWQDGWAATPKSVKKNKPLIAIVVGVIIFVVMLVIVRYAGQGGTGAVTNDTSKQDAVKSIIQGTKSHTTFPNEVDSITTWNDFLEEPGAIRYVYTIHNVDVSKLNDEILRASFEKELKSSMVQRDCNLETRKGVLDKGINMEYLFYIKDSTQTFFFSINRTDCQ